MISIGWLVMVVIPYPYTMYNLVLIGTIIIVSNESLVNMFDFLSFDITGYHDNSIIS